MSHMTKVRFFIQFQLIGKYSRIIGIKMLYKFSSNVMYLFNESQKTEKAHVTFYR